ncbi:MAG: class I SAM-dependent rRNA methyltransferase [Candidatus Omnitrophica bacterium]|nr:class I SAM-dependent rRNA methyltransferase [Candidatus Omnitrophota bacterium]
MKTLRCLLAPGKEKPVIQRHPWIFSGAIDQIEEGYASGDLVRVFSSREQFLGIGYLNPGSQIAVRMLAFEDVPIDEGFFDRRIAQAAALRRRWLPPVTNAYRLVHAEGDFLPGLIVDAYGDFLVVQFLTAGIEVWKEVIVRSLQKQFPSLGVFEKSDSDLRRLEGLGRSLGALVGPEPPETVEILENGIAFGVDVRGGQKTGFFLDQRESREAVRRLSAGKNVLNCFAYTGGFSVYAAKGEARTVVSVESSATAVQRGRENCLKNHLDAQQSVWAQQDVFDYLRHMDRQFDLIILDPPAFCKSKQQVRQAARGYKDINLQALKRVSQGGMLCTFSCSSHISPELFQKILFGAAADAKRDVRILRKISHAFDHPINVYHPEGEYLKGFFCEVL